jgi:hypothetical protein
MKAWVCRYCHAQFRAETEPSNCLFCNRINRGIFTEISLPEPKPDEFSKKYDDSLKTLEKYSEGTDPESRIGEE